ncbi:MAG: EFR1 family ferrodoxin [Promethearchaeia archaeon]
MNIPLIYFSSSGNTKYIAELIQVGFQLADLSPELIMLKDFNKSDDRIQTYKLFGIGGPIYAMSYPPNIMNWLYSLPVSSNNQKYFLFDTNAGLPGNAIQNAKNVLDAKDYQCIGLFEQISPTRDSVIESKYFKYVKWKKRNLISAVIFGYKLGNSLIHEKISLLDCSNNHIFGNELRVLFKPFEKFFYRIFPTLIGFDESQCKRCKLCETNCSREAINFDDRPIFTSSLCIGCFNCLRSCPTNALYFKFFPNARYFQGPQTVSGYIPPDQLLKKYKKARK